MGKRYKPHEVRGPLTARGIEDINDNFDAVFRALENAAPAAATEDWQNAWSTVAFDAANFTASAGTWTVESADQVDFAYLLIGKTMRMAFQINSTSTSAGMGTVLYIKVPSGKKIKRFSRGGHHYTSDGANFDVGFIQTIAGATNIENYTRTAGAWASSIANNLHLRGYVEFEVE